MAREMAVASTYYYLQSNKSFSAVFTSIAWRMANNSVHLERLSYKNLNFHTLLLHLTTQEGHSHVRLFPVMCQEVRFPLYKAEKAYLGWDGGPDLRHGHR